MTARFATGHDPLPSRKDPNAPGVQIVKRADLPTRDALPVTLESDKLYLTADRIFILRRPRLLIAGEPFGRDNPPARLWLHEVQDGGCFRVIVEHDALTGLPSLVACGVSDDDASLDLMSCGKTAPRSSRLSKHQSKLRKETL